MTTTQPVVVKPDLSDPRFQAAIEAERQLFEFCGLTPTFHRINLQTVDASIRVFEVGSGPPLLIIPGGNGDASEYIRLMQHLPGWKLIAINRPGGGFSDVVDHRTVDIRQLAVDTITSVLDAFNLERAPVIANSMGGLWTLWTAIDRPDRISAMVQVGCPALILGTSAPEPMRRQSIPNNDDQPTSINAQPASNQDVREGFSMTGTSREVRQAWPDEFIDASRLIANVPTRKLNWASLMQSVLTLQGAHPRYRLDEDELRTVSQPTCFIWGDNDTFGGLDVARRAADIIPNAELKTVQAGHMVHCDDPQRCATLADAFLKASP